MLCAECLHDYQAEGLAQTAATIVHAWLADCAGEACRCCGATGQREEIVNGQGVAGPAEWLRDAIYREGDR